MAMTGQVQMLPWGEGSTSLTYSSVQLLHCSSSDPSFCAVTALALGFIYSVLQEAKAAMEVSALLGHFLLIPILQ